MSKQMRVHPCAPERLKNAYNNNGRSIRALSFVLGINPYYVHSALKKNEKPANKKLQYKLFFIDRKKREPVPQWKKQLKKLPKNKQEKIWEALLTGKCKIIKTG